MPQLARGKDLSSNYVRILRTTQLTFTCSMSTSETLEKAEICSKLTLETPERRK